jgi:ubiquitin-protein ligase
MTIILRLENELRKMNELAAADDRFDYRTTGLPPTLYHCEWRVPGLERLANGTVRLRHTHTFKVQLGDDFPFAPPAVYWMTPIFHPNIRTNRVCLGTIWYGGSSIAELCVNIRRLVVLEDFNVFDPLDKAAATWLEEKLRDDQAFVPLGSAT